MKRSEINSLVRSAANCFADHGWTLRQRLLLIITIALLPVAVVRV